ncbi:Uncharacterised protein [Porphyromonas macacae]|uniref:Uncharacterized protein n=1 Tax=Porphyromonas macacae TaxID=28115 RepID=A0A379E7J9_9PORP|nr:hypothetical protein [Porphyromonas macacae]SUB88697.1 Uncharacterised protein [Porphyromonas macacae]
MNDKYLGMTVNERLFVSGLMDEFDNAVKKKDISVIISILKKIGLEEESIKPILDSLMHKKVGNASN